MPPALEPLKEGTLLNQRYRILQPVGRGGMGLVYKAVHQRLQSTVAVKEIRNTRADIEEYNTALRQCEQEARMLVRLNHPNLPRVSDAFIERDRFYLVMDYLEGSTLERRLSLNKNRPLGVLQVVLWSLQLTDVLYYLHTQTPPIIFRDLKPGNIMVRPDGHLFLIDFGIARRFQPGATKDTSLLGSVGFSPPEQFGSGQTDARADIYAFGATLHNLLTGVDPTNQPFKFAPANLLNTRVPESLALLIAQCVAMEVEDRPSSIQEVAEVLLTIREEIQGNPLYADETLASPSSASGGLGSGNILSQPLGGSGSGRTGGSREILPPPAPTAPLAGRTAETPRKSLVGAVAITTIVLLVLGVTLFSFTSGKNRVTPASTDNHMTDPKGGVTVFSSQTGVGKREAVLPPPSQKTEPPLTHESGVTFTKVEPQGVGNDPNGVQALRMTAVGEIKNQMGKQGLVVILFFDQAGNPLPTPNRSPENLYMTPEGQVAVAHSIEITEEKQTFDLSLYLPFDQLPVNALSLSYKFRCVVYIENKKIAETEMKDLALVMLKMETPVNPTSGEKPASNPSDTSGAGNP